MANQKAFTLIMSHPTVGEPKSKLAKDGHSCIEILELQPYLSKGWHVKKIEMTPATSGYVTAVIVIQDAPI